MCALVTGVQTCALPIYGTIYGVPQPGELVGGASAGTREYFRKQYRRLDDLDDDVATANQIGKASWREGVCKYVWMSEVDVSLQNTLPPIITSLKMSKPQQI